MRVNKRDQLATAQYELVECVFGALHDVARLDQQDGLDRRIDALDIHGERLHVEVTLELGRQRPCFSWLARHRVEWRAHHRQRAHHAEHWFFKHRHARDGADQVVFEQAFALRAQCRDGLLAVELGDRQAEVELLAGGQCLRLDAIELRGIFFVRVGLGIEFFNHQIAARHRLEFAQQVFNIFGEGL